MKSAILVSVLMTAYNREQYIGEAIESVQASTYSSWELIIVDDGSKDQTVEIAQSYAAKDQRIRVYLNEKNLGDYPNRNKAASYATGKYLKYVDADDLIYPWGLEILVSCMEKFPEAGFGICSLAQNPNKTFPFMLTPNEAYKYHYFHGELFHRAPLSSIIKRSTFEKAGGFKAIRMAGDFEMWHRLGKQWPVVLMPQGIVWYRTHAEQEMKDHSNYLLVYEKIKIENLNSSDVPLTQTDVKKVIRAEKKMIYINLVKSILKFNTKRVKQINQNIKIWRELFPSF